MIQAPYLEWDRALFLRQLLPLPARLDSFHSNRGKLLGAIENACQIANLSLT